LETLFQGLTDNEIRHLRSRLNIKTFQKDICGNLPLELLLGVSQYLELEDLKKALSVSRRWNDVFSSSEFHLGIVKLHFAPKWETSYKGLDPEQQRVRQQALHEWLPDAAMKRIRRLHGRYHAMSTYHYSWGDRCPVDLYGRSERPQYCSGRIAYKVADGTIVVRNLRTGFSAVFADENRVQLSQWLLSDQFILAQTVNP
jgi:hypothetical protein